MTVNKLRVERKQKNRTRDESLHVPRALPRSSLHRKHRTKDEASTVPPECMHQTDKDPEEAEDATLRKPPTVLVLVAVTAAPRRLKQ